MSAITINYAPFLGHEAPSSHQTPNLTSTTCTTTNSTSFVPSHTLHIRPPEINSFRPRDLETRIFSPSGALAYISVSESRRNGKCILQRVTDDAKGMEDMATTEYRFGCFRDAVVRLGDGDAKDHEKEEIVVKRKGIWTRSVGFESPSHGRCEWRDGTKSECAVVAGTGVDELLLILEKKTTATDRGRKEEPKLKIAQLIRSKETRTPGSTGNGSVLEMHLGCNEEDDEEEEVKQADEALIVATCLVMLK